MESLRLNAKPTITEDTYVVTPWDSFRKTLSVVSNNPIETVSSNGDAEFISSKGPMKFYTENRLISQVRSYKTTDTSYDPERASGL